MFSGKQPTAQGLKWQEALLAVDSPAALGEGRDDISVGLPRVPESW